MTIPDVPPGLVTVLVSGFSALTAILAAIFAYLVQIHKITNSRFSEALASIHVLEKAIVAGGLPLPVTPTTPDPVAQETPREIK